MTDRVLTFALEDRFFRARIEELVADHQIETIVETGLDQGLSAVILAGMVKNYFGVDINPDCVKMTFARMIDAGRRHFILDVGNSADALRALITPDPDRTLYFLDAHCFGDTDCPIIQEIEAIPRGKGILAFHDIWVPGREHGGFSPLINGVPTRFDLDLIRPALAAWSPGFKVEYLDEYETELAPGVMFAYPGVF